MVERIEQLEAEAQPMTFGDRECFVQGRIIDEARQPAKGVIAESAKTILRIRSRDIERRRVEPGQGVGVFQMR